MSAAGVVGLRAIMVGRERWRLALAVAASTTALGVALALAGTASAPPPAAWPRFWATTFFVLLLWPVGLSLVGLLAGLRVEAAVAALLLLATAAQHAGRAEIPMPVSIRWWTTLAGPGDALRHRIPLPAPESASWVRSWGRATRAAVFVCTDPATPPDEDVALAVGDRPPVSLSSLEHLVVPAEMDWYVLPLNEPEARRASAGGFLEVVLRREGSGRPLRVCGGRDDPTRSGAGGSERWRDGRWTGRDLADQPFPLVEGRPILARYYFELRFLDAAGRPTVDIWY